MTATVTDADRAAARGLLGDLEYWTPSGFAIDWPEALITDVENTARMIANARQAERDKWIAAAERHVDSTDGSGVCEVLIDMGLL